MKPRGWMALGAALTIAGLAVAGTAPVSGTAPATRVEAQQTAGGVAVVAGWVLLAWGTHRFGRDDDE
jgi:hypothetical protein